MEAATALQQRQAPDLAIPIQIKSKVAIMLNTNWPFPEMNELHSFSSPRVPRPITFVTRQTLHY